MTGPVSVTIIIHGEQTLKIMFPGGGIDDIPGDLGQFIQDHIETGIADFLERLQEELSVDFTLPEGDFRTPVDAGSTRRGKRVFAVARTNVLADLLKRFDRIAHSVKNEVRRVKVNKDVVATNVVKEREQILGFFLTGFQMETLAVLLQVVAVFLNGRDHALIGVGGGIVGNKTDVRADRFNAEQLSEVGDFARFLKPRLARLFRHESNRFRSTRDRFVRFAFKSQKDDGRRNTVLV